MSHKSSYVGNARFNFSFHNYPIPFYFKGKIQTSVQYIINGSHATSYFMTVSFLLRVD